MIARVIAQLDRCIAASRQHLKSTALHHMDYQLKRVAGAVHSAGNVLFDGGDRLFSAIGNRIACVDLRRQAADAVGDFETRSDIDRLALTSDGCLLCAVVPTPASAACPPAIVGLSSPLLLIASLCWYGVHPCGTRPGSVNAAAKYDHSSIAIATWKITAAIATPATSAALAVEFGDRMALGMKSIGATTA